MKLEDVQKIMDDTGARPVDRFYARECLKDHFMHNGPKLLTELQQHIQCKTCGAYIPGQGCPDLADAELPCSEYAPIPTDSALVRRQQKLVAAASEVEGI